MNRDAKTWQQMLQKYPEANFLQSIEYGKMAEELGHKVITEEFDGRGLALIIIRNAKRGRYMEIPCGPLIDWDNLADVQMMLGRLTEIARRHNCVFVRIRPQLLDTPKNRQLLQKLKLKKAPMHLAAERTVMIDLTKSEADLLAKMRRQTRYEVRRADKLGIKVTHANSEQIFRDFYEAQAATAKRQHFIPPDLRTLMAERHAFGDKIAIYTAETESGERIAYGMIIWGGKEGDYYEAASTDLHYKLPGAYAVIWQAAKDLKAAGMERFNLWGIAPANQPKHRYAGVTTFKTGFGGDIVDYVPAQDLIISQTKYLKNWVVETARRKKRHL